MWYIGEGVMYVDENGNSCELKYGDKVKITPCEENDTEYNRFKYELENLRTGKIVHILESIENMLDEYTTDEYSVNETDIPEKPFKFDEGHLCARIVVILSAMTTLGVIIVCKFWTGRNEALVSRDSTLQKKINERLKAAMAEVVE